MPSPESMRSKDSRFTINCCVLLPANASGAVSQRSAKTNTTSAARTAIETPLFVCSVGMGFSRYYSVKTMILPAGSLAGLPPYVLVEFCQFLYSFYSVLALIVMEIHDLLFRSINHNIARRIGLDYLVIFLQKRAASHQCNTQARAQKNSLKKAPRNAGGNFLPYVRQITE